ncbi:MAG TPA: YfcE family phosphodiesterase [Syntrophomonadaceae bacterium]|nr:YfcE family phosphodiesterase [Syntrophomonadaceae bacterium]
MILAAVGDTHGKVDTIIRELKPLTLNYLVFTGDYYTDGKKIARELKVPLLGVNGNCDYRNRGNAEKTVDIEGSKFLIVHGHQYGVKGSLNRLFYYGQELQVNMVVFGHTHIAYCEMVEGMWLFNPGSPTYPRIGTGSYGVINVEKGSLQPVILQLAR